MSKAALSQLTYRIATRVYMCVCVCMYVFIYIYTYTHTYRTTQKTNTRGGREEQLPPPDPQEKLDARAKRFGAAASPLFSALRSLRFRVLGFRNLGFRVQGLGIRI